MLLDILMDNFLTGDDPSLLLNYGLDELKLSITKSNHSLRTGCFATIYDNLPHIRTIVLRDFFRNDNKLFFHSDNRSKKNTHINDNPNSSLLFYSQLLKLQIRFDGSSQLINDDADRLIRFNTSKPQSKVCYGFKIAPNTPIQVNKKELLEPEIVEPLNNLQLSYALENFSVIEFSAKSCEVLYLHHDGHIKVSSTFFANEWHPQFISA